MARNGIKYRRIDVDRREVERATWNKPVLWPIALAIAVLVLGGLPALVSYRRRERAAARRA